MKCSNCKHFFHDKRQKGEVNGECRIVPPPFPSTKSVWWCSKFEKIKPVNGFW